MDNTPSRLLELLSELEQHGFETIAPPKIDGALAQAVVRDVENDQTYALSASDAWVQAAQMLFESSRIENCGHNLEVMELALRLHSRFLGCRVGFDISNNLAVQYDVYPEFSAEHITLALAQLCYVVRLS